MCTFFEQICEAQYRESSKLFLELRHVNLELLPDVFQRVGVYLKEFTFSGGYIMDDQVKQRLVNHILEMPKLSKLSILYIQFPRDLMVKLSTCFKNLTHLNLERCNLDEKNMENIFDPDMKTLKCLKITGNTMLSGKCISNLKHIENLDASFCFDLNYAEIVKFLKNCIHLKKLDISACSKLLDGNIIEDILAFQPKIEELIFENAGIKQDETIFSQYQHLKVLKIEGKDYLKSGPTPAII